MPTEKSGFPMNWTIANIRRSNFCRRPLTILLSNSSRGENRSSRSLGTLAKLSERERTVFELYVVEGFSKGAVSRISGVPTDEVPRIAEKVKEHIRQAIAANQESKERREKAS